MQKEIFQLKIEQIIGTIVGFLDFRPNSAAILDPVLDDIFKDLTGLQK